jgi:glycine/D-amino acid oxidase-like deaminating enzyme
MGYGADEIYTRWAQRSLDLWQRFFAQIGRRELFCPTGVLWMTREHDAYSEATIASLTNAGIAFERLRRDELEFRYPQIDFTDVDWAIYEPASGALMARKAVQAVVEDFVHNDGEVIIEAATAPAGSGKLASVRTTNGTVIEAALFIFACGPWLPKLFPALLGRRIHPTRQEVFFFGPPAGYTRFASPHMPAWIDFGAGIYGLSDLDNRGFKMAFDRHGEAMDPDTADRNVTAEQLSGVREFLARRFPAMKHAPLVESRVCQYENTSNGDFLIDRHPDLDNVWLVGGGSGHGFKHGPALGEYVAARVTGGGEIETRFKLVTKEAVHKRSVF